MIAPRFVIVSPIIGYEDSTIEFKAIEMPIDLKNCDSYIADPATRSFLQALGAQTILGKWGGPRVGEQYIAMKPLYCVHASTKQWTEEEAMMLANGMRVVLCKRIK